MRQRSEDDREVEELVRGEEVVERPWGETFRYAVRTTLFISIV